MGDLEEAGLRLPGVGECAALEPEDLSLEQRVRNRRAIDVDERGRRARADPVDEMGDEPLACSRFPLDRPLA
jgi:hypothetical protein